LETKVNISGKISVSGNLTYTYGQNTSDDEPMRRIPPFNGKIAGHYDYLEPAWISAEWLFASDQNRLSPGDISDPRIQEGGTPGWNVINIYLGYEKHWFSATGSLQNLFDQHYRVHGSGIDGIGRSFWLSVKLSI
jgi:outer membrane receptor protein involved in Fe transport